MARATQSTPFATLAAQIAARCSATGFVANPDPKDGVYRAEAGVYLRFLGPQPQGDSGGGRHALVVRRPFQVWVVTQCLLDSVGLDDAALNAHWATEDAVMNALLDGESQTDKIGFGAGVHWVPGGDEVRRAVKTDPSLYLSVMMFAVEYPAYLETEAE
jgi:hypothetical protein